MLIQKRANRDGQNDGNLEIGTFSIINTLGSTGEGGGNYGRREMKKDPAEGGN